MANINMKDGIRALMSEETERSTIAGMAKTPFTVKYFHPVVGQDGKRLSTANIIWAERDRGSSYYRVSRFAMNAGRFPPSHPCAPFNGTRSEDSSQMGDSPRLTAFRERGYWASCFPEGDGITLKWWDDQTEQPDKTAEDVIRDIQDCFGWQVVNGRS